MSQVLAGACFQCLRLMGVANRMVETEDGFHCEVCKTYHAKHKRVAEMRWLSTFGFFFVLLATVLYSRFFVLQSDLVWFGFLAIYCFYAINVAKAWRTNLIG